jgi:hypothetical protein
MRDAELFQWQCPIRTCAWTYEGTESECRAAFSRHPDIALEAFGYPGGEIHQHIHGAHRVEEWVQDLLDARRESRERGRRANEALEREIAIRESVRIEIPRA